MVTGLWALEQAVSQSNAAEHTAFWGPCYKSRKLVN